MQCGVEKTECHQKLLAENMLSNGWSYKSQVFCRVHRVFNSGTKGLIICLAGEDCLR